MSVRLNPAEEKITENDAFIAEALNSANVPTLMMAMVHVTGDMSLLDGPIKPRRVVSGMVWAHPGARNWYKNARGVAVNTSPWRLEDYWKWMRQPDLADYELR